MVACDLASLASVRACADALAARGEEFDVVIANAGVMNHPFDRTVDGFETHFGTNHLGHFVLVNRLVPLIRDGGRVIVLSSAAHHASDVSIDDPGFERSPYDPYEAYGRSKTANILFALELGRRLRRRGICAVAVHPGGIRTALLRHTTPEVMHEMVVRSQVHADGTRGRPAAGEDGRGRGRHDGVGRVRRSRRRGGWPLLRGLPASPRWPTPATTGCGRTPSTPTVRPLLWAASEALVGERFP